MIKQDEEFEKIISNIASNPYVLDMKNFRQHCDTNTYDHCYMVAYTCYKICKWLNLDYVKATRAGMLHDFYLYDWREKSTWHKWHAFKHGNFACLNASKVFDLSEKELSMIKTHMWPVTPIIPSSMEGIVITIADKYCATCESLRYFFKLVNRNNVIRYAKAFLWVFILK